MFRSSSKKRLRHVIPFVKLYHISSYILNIIYIREHPDSISTDSDILLSL